MKRVGIFGGSFNPVHTGHLRAAECAVEALRLDRLLFLPASRVPGKAEPMDAPNPRQRLQMLQLALDGCAEPRFASSSLELDSAKPLYTYQSLREIRKQYPDAELFLILGSDQLQKFPDWKCAGEIMQNVTLAVLSRGGKREQDRLLAQKQELESQGGRVILLANPVTDISSTQLRRMLVFGCGSAFLPEGVEDYIRDNGLYGTSRDYRSLPMDTLEQVVIRLLNPNRVAHVLGCRDTAVKMAGRWGADETDAARAGILHDITKALDGPLQLTLCAEYGTILDDFSKRYPKTLHALTGSLVAERIFGESSAVVEAIRHHTTGKANMSTLEKIIYVADYMEPNRDFPGVDKLRLLAFTDLDAALQYGLEMTLEHLKRQGDEVSPESREALAWCRQNV